MSRLLDSSGYFDICAFDQLLKVSSCVADPRDYAALRLLHCVHWNKMDAVTRKEAQAAILRTFELASGMSDAYIAAFEDPTPQKVSVFRRLVGGAS